MYNPYPSLGCPILNCRPRGFPLKEIGNEENWKTMFEKYQTKLKSFGVLQSLADIGPDVDAIFRKIQKTPFLFEKPQMSGDIFFRL